MLGLNIVGRIPPSAVQARLRFTIENTPDDEVALVMMLSPELASAPAEDFTALRRLRPAKGLDA